MKKKQTTVDLKKFCAYLIIAYIAATLIFYFAAGEQLFIRDSKNNIQKIPGNQVAGELMQGDRVSQVFYSEMDRIECLSVQLGTFTRQNVGAIQIRLMDTETGTLLYEQTLDTAALPDSVLTEVPVTPPVENIRNRYLTLEIESLTGVPGNAIAPWYNSQGQEDGWQFTFNGQSLPGTLSFQAAGKDLVWTGPHYWQLTSIGGAIVLLCSGVILYRQKKGKRSLFVNAVIALTKYKFLIEQLVSRDFKTKYKRSVLGVLWSFLNPLLTMIVQYVVFSTIFKADIKNYPVYLLTGIVLFGFFSESAGISLMSILGNASLITKVYVPKYIYPVTRVLSSTVNLLISLLPLLIMILFTKTPLTKAYILLIFPLVCLVLFCIGMAFLLSSSMVFFRDTQFLWGVFSLLWMYATPIFYPESILPPEFAIVHRINPMYHFIKFARIIIIDGISPEPRMYLLCAAFALGFLAVGAFVFKKSQDKFVFYI